MIIKYDKDSLDQFLLCVLFFLASGNLSQAIVPASFGFLNQILILAICVSFLMRSGRQPFIRRALHPVALIYLCYLFYFFVSLFWSSYNVSTFLKLFTLSITTFTAAYFSVKFNFIVVLRALFKSQLVIVFLSVATVIFLPSIGMATASHEGAWNGIFDQKNTFGRSVSLLMISSLLLFLCRGFSSRVVHVFISISCIILLILSDSRTALYISLLFTLISLLLYCFRYLTGGKVFSFSSLFIIAFLVIFCFNSDQVYLDRYGAASDFLYFYGVEFPLTGRATLWMFSSYSLEYFDKQIFGFGFDGFWGRTHSIMYNWGMDNFTANDSHSGFYDVMLQGGYVGLSLLTFVVISVYAYISAGLRFSNYFSYFRTLFCFVIFVYILVANLTESTFLKSTNIIQFLFSYIIFYYGVSESERSVGR